MCVCVCVCGRGCVSSVLSHRHIVFRPRTQLHYIVPIHTHTHTHTLTYTRTHTHSYARFSADTTTIEQLRAACAARENKIRLRGHALASLCEELAATVAAAASQPGASFQGAQQADALLEASRSKVAEFRSMLDAGAEHVAGMMATPASNVSSAAAATVAAASAAAAAAAVMSPGAASRASVVGESKGERRTAASSSVMPGGGNGSRGDGDGDGGDGAATAAALEDGGGELARGRSGEAGYDSAGTGEVGGAPARAASNNNNNNAMDGRPVPHITVPSSHETSPPRSMLRSSTNLCVASFVCAVVGWWLVMLCGSVCGWRAQRMLVVACPAHLCLFVCLFLFSPVGS